MLAGREKYSEESTAMVQSLIEDSHPQFVKSVRSPGILLDSSVDTGLTHCNGHVQHFLTISGCLGDSVPFWQTKT